MKEKPLLKFSHNPSGKSWETFATYILPDGQKTSLKPESMTQLVGNQLVYKDNPKIILRGKLDTFQAELISMISVFKNCNTSPSLMNQLKELLEYSRLILSHEVLNKELITETLLSWTPDEIRNRSHNPHLYFGLEQMILIDENFGEVIIKLNIARAKVREIELASIHAFRKNNEILRNDLITALNRMSSCFHILMYQEISYTMKKL